ncbi:MAG: type I methionyl aminopeptidase [Candidatus Tagabacteria bacterium RIFCSPLOWO2_01_FULL_42_9]|uniref:Methionine aminopeptidase n=1 Tax=Candidatus Tagabacteria bacterium RIFCSPLOWO2_01_FULL_42_9 TaxID=1802296 RepID=A0A1G2LWX8_9BACT|nr:MAG: type I methionyl aminopeptidase [Candidatus Tagabacteria bacterium RIFCSPLOWO2_01_FULL_42_9]
MITVKTPEEIKILKDGGKILASVLLMVAERAKPGVATLELDKRAEFLIKKAGGEPAFLNYKEKIDKYPFPASLCVSINDEVVHGIPSKERILKEGDIVGLDLGLKWNGFYTDATITVGVGKISEEAQKLLDTTKSALDKGIASIKENAAIGDIGFAIQSHVEKNGFNVVKKLVGHGVGYDLHEEPEIPNWGEKKTGIVLKQGMVLALEPMATMGNGDVYLAQNNWTWKEKNGFLSAHFEHTIAVAKNGAEVLTRI